MSPRNPRATGLGYLPKGGAHKALENRAAAMAAPIPIPVTPEPVSGRADTRQRGGRFLPVGVLGLVGASSAVSWALLSRYLDVWPF